MTMLSTRASRILLCILTAGACGASAAPPHSASDAGANWLGVGRTDSEQRFSPLAQITRRNVGKLGLDWALDMPDAISFNSTPLAVDGVLYFSGDRSIVRAVDARTGALLWTHDPQVWRHAPRGMAAAAAAVSPSGKCDTGIQACSSAPSRRGYGMPRYSTLHLDMT